MIVSRLHNLLRYEYQRPSNFFICLECILINIWNSLLSRFFLFPMLIYYPNCHANFIQCLAFFCYLIYLFFVQKWRFQAMLFFKFLSFFFQIFLKSCFFTLLKAFTSCHNSKSVKSLLFFIYFLSKFASDFIIHF